MNQNGETRIARIAAIIIVVLILFSLCSCKTKTMTTTEYVNIHDTVTVHKSDTVREVRLQVIRDTTIQKEVHTYTINDVGDTIKEIHHYHDREKVIVVDSTDRYKAKLDSLQKIVDSNKEKVKVVVKEKRVFKWLDWIILGAILAVIFFFVIKRWGKVIIDRY